MSGPIAEYKSAGLRLQLLSDRIISFKAWNKSNKDEILLSSITSIELHKGRGKLKIVFDGGFREWDGGFFDSELETFTSQLRTQSEYVRQNIHWQSVSTVQLQHPEQFCTSCGSPLKPEDKFCSICGSVVSPESRNRVAAPQVVQVPVPIWVPPYQPNIQQAKKSGTRISGCVGFIVIAIVAAAIVRAIGSGDDSDDVIVRPNGANPAATTRSQPTATKAEGKVEILNITTKDAGIGDGSLYAYVDIVNNTNDLIGYFGLDGTCRDATGQPVATGFGNTANVAPGERTTVTVIFLSAEGCTKVQVKTDALTDLTND